jgi:cytochrome bd-type quinol oxidase subunit 1
MLVLSPSMIICLLLFTAFLTTAFYITLCRMFRLEEKLLPSFPWQFEMSIISACVFAAAYAVSVLFSAGNATALSLTAENIIIILTPGFALVGARRAINRVKARNGGFITAVVGVIAFLLLFINITAFFISISFLGVIETVMDRVKIRMSGIK